MQKLPLVLGQEMAIRSLDREYFQLNAKVVGARTGEFILLDNLILEMNDRLFVRLQGSIKCSYILQGKAYVFQSEVLDSISYDLSLIRYPGFFETNSLRKHTRVKINLETVLSLEGVDNPAAGSIIDLSNGGCRLLVDKVFYVDRKMKCRLDFTLPNGQAVNGLAAAIRSINISKLKRTTDLGLQFTGPREELKKVAAFCDFCRKFKL